MLIGHDHIGCAAADRDSGPEAGGILNTDDIGLRGDYTFYIRTGTDIQAAAVSGAEVAAFVAADADIGCGRGDPRVWMPGVDLDSGENMLTLYTCVRNQRDQRWCVTAAEV